MRTDADVMGDKVRRFLTWGGECNRARLRRLVPFVESNDNVIELDRRETGKTYVSIVGPAHYMYKNTALQAF